MDSTRSPHLIVRIRTIIFGISLLFTLIALGTSAAFIAFVDKGAKALGFLGGSSSFNVGSFAHLVLATSVITLISVPLLYWFGRQKHATFKAQIFVELPAICIIWILWIASAGQTAQFEPVFRLTGCSPSSLDFGFNSIDQGPTTCHEGRAMMAFSFLNWLLFMSYAFILAFYVFKAQHCTGTSTVWFSSVETFDWNGALLGGSNYAAKAAAVNNVHSAQGGNGAYNGNSPNGTVYNSHANGVFDVCVSVHPEIRDGGLASIPITKCILLPLGESSCIVPTDP
ncbi:hypothetical protein CC2G_000049 [Coprinopsis cinerea AmutBmut pab1-1]|nr:hypothetical protein CC2G_000049 [Coprinopsis cinerea AmutBmut pab1-1]